MMKKNILFILGYNNQIDQFTPIIYRLATSEQFVIDVLIEDRIPTDDYRVTILRKTKNVNVIELSEDSHRLKAHEEYFYKLRRWGRQLPIATIKYIYNYLIESRPNLLIPNEFFEKNHDVLAFCLVRVDNPDIQALIDVKDAKCVLLPHGGPPYLNNIYDSGRFAELLQKLNSDASIRDTNKINVGSPHMLQDGQIALHPNRYNAEFYRRDIESSNVHILGSPRYCPEYIDFLNSQLSNQICEMDSKFNALLLMRPSNYFLNLDEVRMTIDLIKSVGSFNLIIQEHPTRSSFSKKDFLGQHDVRLISDSTASASLVRWADIVLSLGSSLDYEALVLNKPVIGLDYCHSNQSVIGKFFPEYAVKTKDQLLEYLNAVTYAKFPLPHDQISYNHFFEEIVAPAGLPVLDKWLDIFNKIVEE